MGLFDKLESKLEQGVNGAFARAFKSEVQPVEIASGIRRAMDDRAASVGRGKRPIVPNLFTIELSPTDYDRLSAWGDELDDELIASAQEHADEQRYSPGGPFTIVLQESETLETGVFRLRPATAKAAEALAQQRANVRPRNQQDERNSHDSSNRGPRPGRDAGRPAAAAAGTAAGAGAAAPASRGFGSRIKDYLTGYAPDDAAQPAPGEQPQPREPREDIRRDDRQAHGTNGDYGYDDRSHAPDPFEGNTNRAPSSLGGAYSWDAAGSDAPRRQEHDAHDGHDEYDGFADERGDERAGHDVDNGYADDAYDNNDYGNGFDDAHPDNRATGRGLAWDDDDDYGDPTGFSPAEEPQDSTARHVPAGGGARPPRPVSPRERPWLKIDGQRYPLLGAITVLGRDDEADIIIDDPGVSRSHSEIRITHDGPHLVMSARDLASTNGTYVNGERIDSTHVHDGDRLTLGRTSMTIHLGDRT